MIIVENIYSDSSYYDEEDVALKDLQRASRFYNEQLVLCELKENSSLIKAVAHWGKVILINENN